jgi:hypothetical protein
MAYDTDNNVAVSGFSGEAVIATDYSASEGNHFQVMKIAYGGVAEGGTRVTSSNGLPVAIVNTPSVTVSSVSGSVTVTGTVNVNTHAVTATDLDIRTLTAGDPTTAGAIAQDVVRVVGYSGGWAVGVTATNFGIRALTAGDPATAGAAGQDVVRIVGYSGGWAVGVTATDLDIRSLTYGSDSVSVFNTIAVTSASDALIDTTSGFETRLLRASSGANPFALGTLLRSNQTSNAEDTVRVVGLSGAWPVSVFSHGLTNINNYNTKVPFSVDSTGALFVNLASGSISVTADVGSINIGAVSISGISLGVASTSAGALQIHGYNGSGAVLVGVSGDVGITGSAYTQLTTINTNTARVLGASGDYVGLTGEALTALNSLKFTGNNLQTQDASTVAINSAVSTINTNIGTIEDILTSTTVANSLVTANGLKVDIKAIAQPTGGTANKVAIASGSAGTSTIFSSVLLSSGVHFRSDLNNTGTIFIGFSTAVSSQGGFPLYNGDQIFIETDNLNRIHAWSTIAGATLYYIGT